MFHPSSPDDNLPLICRFALLLFAGNQFYGNACRTAGFVLGRISLAPTISGIFSPETGGQYPPLQIHAVKIDFPGRTYFPP